MALQNDVALVALVVSLIALLIASGQLLQQVFGTAEGFRRCQASIIGAWSRTRRRRYKISELRIETTFNTPEFTLLKVPWKSDRGYHEKDCESGQTRWWRNGKEIPRLASGDICTITGDRRSQLQTMTTWDQYDPRGVWSCDFSAESKKRRLAEADYVGWLRLLQQLHAQEIRYESLSTKSIDQIDSQAGASTWRLRPAVRSWPRSWDLLPPDVLKPPASSTLRDIMILSIRLGMSWTVLRPAEGILQAEGYGHSLTSEHIRGLGFVLRYDYNDYSVNYNEGRLGQLLLIPNEAADKFAFGIIPGCDEFDLKDLELGGGSYGDSVYIDRALRRLGVSKESRDNFASDVGSLKLGGDNYRLLAGIYDIQYIWAPFLPLPTLGAVKFIPPLAHSFSCFSRREGRLVWLTQLQSLQEFHPPLSPTLTKVLDRLEKLRAMDPAIFDKSDVDSPYFAENALTAGAQNRLKWLRMVHDETTTHFRNLQAKYPHFLVGENARLHVGRGLIYRALITAHLEMAFRAERKLKWKPKKRYRTCDAIQGTHIRWLAELAHLYAENVDEVVELMVQNCLPRISHVLREKRKSQEILKEEFSAEMSDAWWMMALRAIVWSMSVNALYHSPVGFPLPSQLYHSERHVYIV